MDLYLHTILIAFYTITIRAPAGIAFPAHQNCKPHTRDTRQFKFPDIEKCPADAGCKNLPTDIVAIGLLDNRQEFERCITNNKIHDLCPGGYFRYRKSEVTGKNIFQTNTRCHQQITYRGIHYVLPLLTVANLQLNSEDISLPGMGEDIESESRLQLNGVINEELEYTLDLHYTLTKYFEVSTNYDGDDGFEVGMTFNY